MLFGFVWLFYKGLCFLFVFYGLLWYNIALIEIFHFFFWQIAAYGATLEYAFMYQLNDSVAPDTVQEGYLANYDVILEVNKPD